MNNDKLEIVQKVYRFWGKHPLMYTAQDYITFIGKPQLIRQEAVNALHLKKGDTVLEVACGTGRNFPYIEEQISPSGNLIGFDYSFEMLSSAKKAALAKGWENIKFVQGDAAELNVKKNQFDGVISVLGMSAIPNYRAALKRCFELLRPGGTLVICDAGPFRKGPKFLNGLIDKIYSKYAAWDSRKDIIGEMKSIFGNVDIKTFNFDSFYIVKAIKNENTFKNNSH